MPTSTQKADRAIAQITEPTDSPTQMFAAGNKHIAAINKSPDLASAPAVKTANDAWNTENANLGAANQTVVDCETALDAARANQATVVRRWNGRAKGVLNAINVYSDGSKDVIKGFGLGVAERSETPLETVPTDLRGVRSKSTGTATWKWKTHKGNHGYMVQHCTNPTDATTFSVPVYSSAGNFELPGQTAAATLYLRVAACDTRLPGRQTEYTAWASAVVST